MKPDESRFKLRRYQPRDALRVVEIVNANAARSLGIRQAVVDGAGIVRMTRYVSPTSEKVVVTDVDGTVVGFAYCVDQERAIISSLGGAVHPDFWEQGIGTMLVGWAKQRAADIAGGAPPGVRSVLQASLFEQDSRAIRLYTQLGFQKVREWAHLVIELASMPAQPVLSGGLTLRAMDLDMDWDLVGPAMDDAFANHWGAILEEAAMNQPAARNPPVDQEPEEEILEDESYSNAPGFCFIVLDGQEAAGGILCNARLVELSDSGRVGSLFVRQRYQRLGIGRALMLAAFNAFWERGITRIITDTDAESFTQAPAFYASLGMRLYRREFLYEKEIRPGREARRLSS